MSAMLPFNHHIEPSFPATHSPIVQKSSCVYANAFPSSHRIQTSEWDSLTTTSKSLSPALWQEIDGTLLVDNILSVLNESKKRKDAKYARLLHNHICSYGMDTHEFLGNYLVPLLVESKDNQAALSVFQRLSCRNEHSWTSLIQGYVDNGDYMHALLLFEKMQQDGVYPNKYTYLALLKPCAEMSWLEKGETLHAEIVKEGFEEDIFVGSTLASLYAKSGALKEAQDVFEVLPVKDVVMWNTLITALVDHGFAEKPLTYLRQMELERVSPDIISYVSFLKACRMLGALDLGRKLHLAITKKGFESDLFLGSAAVGLYADCGCLEEAHVVFAKVPSRDVVLWSTLISGYVDQNLGKEALSCLEKMQSEGLSPDPIAFVNSLKACSCIEATSMGQETHMEIVKHGFDGDCHVSSSLLAMYAKLGLIAEALEVFKQQPVRNVGMWNSLMATYIEHGMFHTTLGCFEEMQLEGSDPDDVTFICMLKACANICAIARGREIHKLVIENQLDQDPFIGNVILGMYANCGLLVEAREVFDNLLVQDVVSWSALIAGYTDHELEREALKALKVMELNGVSPNAITYVHSLKACANLSDVEEGLLMHSAMTKKGLEKDNLVANTFVYMYSKCNAPLEAEKVFNGLLEKDVVSWNAAILGFSEEREMEKTSALYHCMQEQGLLPDCTTLASVIKGCKNATDIAMGKRVHSIIHTGYSVPHDSITTNSLLATALIDMYGRCGSMMDARQVFDEMHTHNLTSWTSLLTAYTNQGESQVVIELFESMREKGIWPNGVTFLSVLSACKHGGFADKAEHYLKIMISEYGLYPTMEHRDCVVDLFSRAGRTDEMIQILESVPLQPSLVTWTSIFSSCQQMGDLDSATKAFDDAMSSAEDEAAPFIYLSNALAIANI